jgi:Putative zinc-finger
MTEDQNQTEHERMKELAALANASALTPGEQADLEQHLRICPECREIHDQYVMLVSEGFPMLAASYADQEERPAWNDSAISKKLFARVRAWKELECPQGVEPALIAKTNKFSRRVKAGWVPLAFASLAACLLVALAFDAYRLGGGKPTDETQAFALNSFQNLSAEKRSMDQLLDAQNKKISQLQEKSSQKEKEIARLKLALGALEQQGDRLKTESSAADLHLQSVSMERDSLTSQLRDLELAYRNVNDELVDLRAGREKAALRTTSLESTIDGLKTTIREDQRRLTEDEQFLAEDRDVRDLMGARKLYIADVFDVDGNSRTRGPFGRIFYTQEKSLIFYAFDLDKQPGFKNAKAFQVWGRKETDQRSTLDLGILYLDNESNRRWVLRFDDPDQLAKIDAVFVTVEPHGGSRKPTGKPFLYALLRKEANHP